MSLVKVRALTTWKGREGKVFPGEIIEVQDHRARELVTTGRAVLLKIEEPAETKEQKPLRKRRKRKTSKVSGYAAGDDE